MDHIEITNELKKDYDHIMRTTVIRLCGEYDRERKKLKIDKRRTYTKIYCIKTARKNNWILFIRKAPSEEIYKPGDNVLISTIAYYYNKTGLRVFDCRPAKTIGVYNGHFFTRYNERMKLDLSSPLDIVKHYFKYNGYQSYKVVQKDNRNYMIGVSKDGLTLGEMQHGIMWIVNKTFISKDIFRSDQDEEEKELIAAMQSNIVQLMIRNNTNETKLGFKMDVLTAIRGLNMD